jgi:hypothetical protein
MGDTSLKLKVGHATTAVDIGAFLSSAVETRGMAHIRAYRQKSAVPGEDASVVLFVRSGKEPMLQRLKHFLFSSRERRLGAETLLAQLEKHFPSSQQAAFSDPAHRADGCGASGKVRRLRARDAFASWQGAFPQADAAVQRLAALSTAVIQSCQGNDVLKTGCDDLIYLAYLPESDRDAMPFRRFLGCGEAMPAEKFSGQEAELHRFLRMLRQPAAPGTRTALQLNPSQRKLLEHALAFSHQWMKASSHAEWRDRLNYYQAHAMDMVVKAMIEAFPDALPYKLPATSPATPLAAQVSARYQRCRNAAGVIPEAIRQRVARISRYEYTDWVS